MIRGYKKKTVINTKGNKPYTKRVRYSHLSAFFNFFRNNIDTDMGNPCDTPMIRKLYRERVVSRREIIEKETVEEIIFRTVKVRNWLILDLMARGGMRIGEVLKLTPSDVVERKLLVTSLCSFCGLNITMSVSSSALTLCPGGQ
jgi:integrase/recombinase XerD